MNFKKLINYFSHIFSSNLGVFTTLTFIVFILYFQSLSFDFVALDDYDLIVNKQHILREIRNFPMLFQTNLFMSESGAYYRPVVMLSFMIDALIGGKNPFIYHLSNVLYHLIACLLLFVLLKNLIESNLKSFVMSLFFSIHPAISQAVVWIPGRNDSLLLIFLSLTIITLIKSFTNNWKEKLFFLVASPIFFLAALFTKENAVLILFFILFYLISIREEEWIFKKIIQLFLLYIIPLILYFTSRLRAEVETPSTEFIVITLTDYLKGLISYFGKIFIPLNLSVITLPENINPFYGILSLVIFIWISITGIKDLKIYTFGILWFIFFLISGITGLIGFTNFLDHRLYVPTVGIFISISQLKIFERLNSSTITLILTFYFLTFFYLNFNHTKKFSDPLNFYQSAVESAPQSFFTQRGLANVYHRLKQYDLAEKHYRISISLNPNSAETFLNIGINFKKKGMLDSAEHYFIKSIQKKPNLPIAHNNLGNLYLQKNLIEQSELHLTKAIQINPEYFEAYNNLGVLFVRRGDDTTAYQFFRKSIELNPFFAEGYFNLALYFYNKNLIDSSLHYYQLAIKNGFSENNLLRDKLTR
ncbi:MAG: tetratricopeptide repeat protein [Ignavibacteria bacterium]